MQLLRSTNVLRDLLHNVLVENPQSLMKHSFSLEMPFENSPQTRWLKQLDSVDKPGDLGQLIVDYVEDYAECVAAKGLWEMNDVYGSADQDGS